MSTAAGEGPEGGTQRGRQQVWLLFGRRTHSGAVSVQLFPSVSRTPF